MFKKWIVALSFIVIFMPAHSAMARLRAFARNGLAQHVEALNAGARAMRVELASETGETGSSWRNIFRRYSGAPRNTATPASQAQVPQQRPLHTQFRQAQEEGMRMRQSFNSLAEQANSRPVLSRSELEALLPQNNSRTVRTIPRERMRNNPNAGSTPRTRPQQTNSGTTRTIPRERIQNNSTTRPLQRVIRGAERPAPRPRQQESVMPELPRPAIAPYAVSSAPARLASQAPQRSGAERIVFPTLGSLMTNADANPEEEQQAETDNQQNQTEPQEKTTPEEEQTETQDQENDTAQEEDEDYEYGTPEEDKDVPFIAPTEEKQEDPAPKEEIEQEQQPANTVKLPVHELPAEATVQTAPKGDSVKLFESAFAGKGTEKENAKNTENSQLKNVRSSVTAGKHQKPEIRKFVPKPSGQLYKKEPRPVIKRKKQSVAKETIEHTTENLFDYVRDLFGSLFKLIQKLVQPLLFWL